MESIIVLATVMALLGVLGYVRGTRSTLLTSAVIWVGLMVIGHSGDKVARTVNGLHYAVRFALSGGLGALGGGGDRAANLEAVFSRIGEVQPLIDVNGTGLGMSLVMLVLVIAGFLLGMLKPCRGQPSFLGLGLGLANGYVLGAFLVRNLLRETGIHLPLPAWLFGSAQAGAAFLVPTGPSSGSTLAARISATLDSLAGSGQLALVLSITIAVFVLLATRLGGRNAKKG